MSAVRVGPGPVAGRCAAPPSKSYTHRALVAGFLVGRRYRIRTPSRCADTRATRHGIAALGTAVEIRTPTEWWLVPGTGLPPPRARVACGGSGTTLRFLTAVAATRDVPVTFTGHPALARRPMEPLLRTLALHGADLRGPPAGSGLPFTLHGPITPGRYEIDGSQSSQFLSALLMVLPVLDGPSVLRPRGPTVSRPYIEATRALLRAHGVPVGASVGGFRIAGGAAYRGDCFTVPGDCSSAAYLWAAGAVAGGPVRVTGIDPKWPQADAAILGVLARMGARVDRRHAGATVAGPLARGVRFDATDAPDLACLVAVLAALAPSGPSRITGLSRLAGKESDRQRAAADLAHGFGARVRASPASIEIVPGARPASLRFEAPDDHRVVMSAAVGMLALRGASTVGPAEAVRKSYPGFWSALAALGAPVRGRRSG